jgi:protein-tyrosine-phosphatase
MAEALMTKALEERGCDGIDVASAGTWALEGSSATADAIEVVWARGIDLSAHRSRPLDRELIADSDLIVAMARDHVREIVEGVPEADAKVVLLKQLPGLDVSDRSRAEGVDERLRAVLSAGASKSGAGDVGDPIGLGRGAYERCVRELDTGIRALVELLCSDPVDA